MSTETNENQLSVPSQTPASPPLPVHYSGPLAFLVDTNAFNHLWRVAKSYAAAGTMVPKNFQGKPEDCFVACQLALRLGCDPYMLMQNTYIVHGRPGFEAKLATALLNSSGKLKGTLKYSFDGSGDAYGCRAWGIDAETGEKVVGPKVDWSMVKAEGWNKDKQIRDGGGVQKSKWNTMPDLMFTYRAATFFIRTNYPEVLMGMQTRDELEDSVIDVEVTPSEPPPSKAQAMAERIKTSGSQPVSREEPEPTTPTQEAPADEPQIPSDPDEPQPSAVDEWLRKIQLADNITQCRKFLPDLISMDERLSDAEKADLKAACEARAEVIRGQRGERSKGGAA